MFGAKMSDFAIIKLVENNCELLKVSTYMLKNLRLNPGKVLFLKKY